MTGRRRLSLMLRKSLLLLLALAALAPAALATSFIVPDDDELIGKADAIVIGNVEGKWVDATRFETIYEIRVERAIKGGERADALVRVTSPGAELDGYGVFVPGAPRFDQGERVLLFLTRDKGRWITTDLTLGKFKFETSTIGAKVLVRDAENIVGWDRNGAEHVERVRREAGFVHFIEERVAGRRPAADYFVAPGSVTIQNSAQENAIGAQPNAPAFPAYTYTDNVQLNGAWIGTRWSNISGGVTFYKRSETNISGPADGGASVIQNGLASWNNEAGSNINLIYGGNRAGTPSANQDGISVVEFNDPQGRVGGSWGGSGTIAITFISYFNPHTFANTQWWSIRDADVVFQDGFPGTHAAFPTAMTHELGHGIGFRHSNAHYIRSTGADEPCNSSVEECSNNAIMYFTAVASLGYTLQTWDINAAQAVYPGSGGGTCTPPSFTAQPQSRTITSGQSTTLTVGASGTTPLSYQWYTGTTGNTGSPVPGGTGSSITVSPASTTNYWVRVSNACGSINSNTATVTVNPPAGGVRQKTPADFNGDHISDFVLYRNSSWIAYNQNTGAELWRVTPNFVVPNGIPLPMDYDGDGTKDFTIFRVGQGWHFLNDNGTYNKGLFIPDAGAIPVPADYDGDGKDDVVIYRNGTWTKYDFNTGAVVWNVTTDNFGDGIPVPMDYNGDGRADFTIFRPGLTWLFYNATGGIVKGIWIGMDVVPVPGDYDGNGTEDVVAFNRANPTWLFYDFNSGAFVRGVSTPGSSVDGDPIQPAPLDYDGDGSVDFTYFNGGPWDIWLDNGTIRNAFWTGGYNGDVAISRRTHTRPGPS